MATSTPIAITSSSTPPAQCLKSEMFREYDFGGRVHRIDDPQTLWVGKTTHRVLDHAGIVHCVPSPGFHGCVVRWKPVDPAKPVTF
jgi:hypothetical protein